MCGIVGVFTHAPNALTHNGWVASATDLMVRRGPDDEGFWSSEHMSLGFRRLSILDLSTAGHQPMVTADNQGVLVFNGELYNFRELRTALERVGIRFRSKSDSEVVLYALHVWGIEALSRFDGMFALGYFNSLRNELLLARDPVGIKPLYILQHRDGLVFGSQYDQVVRHRWCDRQRINMQALGSFLRLGWVAPPEGLIEDTSMIEPGTSLVISPGQTPRISVFRSFFSSVPEFISPELTNNRVDEAVASSVKAQMVSDVPVGVFLSGGIDSPLVAAEAKNLNPDIPSFTIGSDDPRHDESSDARKYANEIGTVHSERTLSANQARAQVDLLVRAYSEPFSDFSALPTLLVSALARETVTVALSGDGGDELFWGYPRFPKVANAAPWFRLPRAGRQISRQMLRISPRHRPPAGIDFPSLGEWYLNSHAYLRARDMRRVAPEVARSWTPPPKFVYDGPFTKPDVLQWLRRNEWHYHLPMILLKVDRASMFHSLEVRVPLLGNTVVETAERTDPLLCISATAGKLPLRSALANRVGNEIITSGKRGFSAPLGDWLKKEFRPLVEESLLNEIVFGSDFLHKDAIRRLYSQHTAGTYDHTKALWALLTLQRWADNHLRPLEPRPI